MGKRTRRKHRHHNSKDRTTLSSSSSSPNTTQHQSSSTTTTSTTTATLGPAILQRIRHADPKTRLAALSALLQTRFDPVSLVRRKPPSTSLLQAVREQVMMNRNNNNKNTHSEDDLNCAITAAACLANYAAFGAGQQQQDTVTAGWMVLLVGRLKECVFQLQQQQQQQQQSQQPNTTTAAAAATAAIAVQWWELTEQCMSCLVHLLENNSQAMERLIPSSSSSSSSSSFRLREDTQQPLRHDTMQVLTDLLHLSVAAIAYSYDDNNNMIPAATTAVGQQQQQQQEDYAERLKELQISVCTLSCRGFHSAWDDNLDLLLPWLEEDSATTAQQTLQGLHGLLQQQADMVSNNNTYNNSNINAACLHAVGAWLAAWSIVVATTTTTTAPHQPMPSLNIRTLFEPVLQQSLPACIKLLHTALVWDTNERMRQIQQLQAAFAEYEKQQADNALERQVLEAQEQKKEPARLIARRLKAQKKDPATAMETDAMTQQQQQDDDDDDHPNALQLSLPPPPDTAAIWEDSMATWHDSIRPVQIALEITANLTSTTPEEQKDDDDDDDNISMAEEEQTLNAELVKLLLQNRLPDQLLQLLNQLISPTWQRGLDDNNTYLLPALVESVSDLQSKAAVCLGHCLTNLTGGDPDKWNPPDFCLWQNLKSAWNAAADVSAREAIGSTMVVALRSSRTIRTTQIQSDDVDFLLQICSARTPSSSLSVIVKRDAICMLGILCGQESHPAALNQKVVQEMMQAAGEQTNMEGTNHVVSAMILAEVLSALMDIYSDDDCHPQVFESLNVLNFFQRSLPVLKRRISVEQREANDVDVDQWKETAMNAARFVQYKKGHES